MRTFTYQFMFCLLCGFYLVPNAEGHILLNYNGSATGGGSGCDGTNLDLSFGDDSISVNVMGLKAFPTGSQKVDLKTCRVIVPLKIEKGWYISAVEESVYFDYHRTEGTDGKVSLGTAVYFSENSILKEIPIPSIGYDPFKASVSHSEITNLSSGVDNCGHSDYIGNSKINLVFSAFRKNVEEQIKIEGKNPVVFIKFITTKCP